METFLDVVKAVIEYIANWLAENEFFGIFGSIGDNDFFKGVIDAIKGAFGND